MTARWSLAERIAAALGVTALAAAALTALAAHWLPAPIAALLAFLALAPLLFLAAERLTGPWIRTLRALGDGILSLRDHDFSVSIASTRDPELAALTEAYNSLGDLLRRERLDLYQRELLLDTVIQSSPLAMLLTDASERVVYSNVAARQLLHNGRKLEGMEFARVLADSPAALREALGSGEDTLFTMDVATEAQVFHLSQRRFLLNARPHRLVLLKQLTRELAAQEVAVWKKVIRVIAHELNNSLAPISSLAHSGGLLTQESAGEPLARVFATIGERAAHLASFIDGYARFAKLPRPRPAQVRWAQLLARLEGTVAFRTAGALPARDGSFDASQIEQVMINLLKNAAESGSRHEQITVAIADEGAAFRIEVGDRGAGLTESALRDALLPFYSTKAAGTGLGLTLCREIVEAHGGRLSLANRADGGALVTVWLPA
ncbi:MAG TPA: ATP-binding protein [Steroidobacteraceae bacterium]|nr:ATP-binding protein [Steroidobacteraceae bacterium]